MAVVFGKMLVIFLKIYYNKLIFQLNLKKQSDKL